MLRYLTSGESHGQSLISIIDGLPSNIELNFDEINLELKKRQCGYGRGGRMKIESDKVNILGGVRGRKTLESFPNGLPLKNRTNIVITGNRDYQVKGAVIVHSIEEALKEVEKYPAEDVYCIGGDSIYKQMLPYCDTAHVTKIDFSYEADAYFPNLDEDPDWEITAESEEQTYFDLEYAFVKYERKDR